MLKYLNNIYVNFIKNDNEKIFGQIDILKFLLAIVVILSHFYMFELDAHLPRKSCGSISVHCFFIISGFFFYYSVKKIDTISFETFCLKKIFRLYPVFFFNVCLYGGYYFKHISSIFMLSIGVESKHIATIWYVGVLFYVTLFYFYLYKNFQKKNVNLTIAIIIYFSCMFLINKKPAWFGTYQNKFIFLNSGLVRGLMFIGLGIFTHIIYDKIMHFIQKRKEKQSEVENKKEKLKNKIYFVIFSFFEITLFYKLIRYLFFKKNIDVLSIGLEFCILICLFVSGKGLLSKILNNKISVKLGEYSYSIYVMHYICLKALNCIKIGGKNIKEIIVDANCYNTFLVSSCVLFGIIVYYLIEKPSYKYLSDKFLNK